MSDRDVPGLSVIIVTHNSLRTLPACMDSLLRYAPSGSCDMWVVDNASSDGTVRWFVDTHPGVRHIALQRNIGFGAANNLAIAASKTRYSLLLNPDAQVTAGCIDALVNYLEEHPRVAVVGPRIIHPDGSLQRSAYTFPTVAQLFFDNFFLADLWPSNPVTGPFKRWAHDETRPVPWLVGACLLIRRSVVAEIGGFDERFFLFAEETDLCRRLWAAGHETHFLAAATAIHEEKGSFTSAAFAAERSYESIRRYFLKHSGPVSASAVGLIQLAGAALRVVLLTPVAPFSARLRKRWTYHTRKASWYLGLRRSRV